MIAQMFIRILNMSLTGGFVILAVLLIRLFLKKAPKIFSYCLWAVVLFRLLCPVSFTAPFSPFPVLPSPSASPEMLSYLPEDLLVHPRSGIAAPKDTAGTQTVLLRKPAYKNKRARSSYAALLTNAAAFLWLGGAAALALRGMLRLKKLKQSLKSAVWEKDNIFKADGIATPFVMGILHPVIYLPSHLEAKETEYVLLHEQIHIKRRQRRLKISCTAGYAPDF